MLIFTHEQYLNYLEDRIKQRPKKVLISTFNLHVGINSAGGTYDRAPMFQIMSELQRTVSDVKVLIGTIPTIGGKVINTAEHFSGLHWRFRDDLHLKCWIFHYGKHKGDKHIQCITGGRNLGDSQWHDVSVTLSPPDSWELENYFQRLWKNSKPVPTTSFTLKH